MNRSLGPIAVAGLVVIALLPGAMVQDVLAFGGSPREMVAANPQVDAEPTPTPTSTATPEPTPSPQPTPTPTPTPIATPTPFDETVAQVTALSIIDPDGNPTTTADRHVFDGQWEFEAAFGAADVLSADPTSDGTEPAYWLIDYNVESPVRITDLVAAGYSLLDVECLAAQVTVQWHVEGTSVLGTVSGEGPIGLNCQFIHTPVLSEATPRITLPPTDVSRDTARQSGNLPLLLLLFIAIGLSVLVLSLDRATGRRGRG